jgi:hypothetical protein
VNWGIPQNPGTGPSTAEIKKDSYEKYGDILNQCLKEVFGKDAPETQTKENAPTLITIETSNTLKTRTKFKGHGNVVGTIDIPQKGKAGAIKIAEEIAVHYGPLSAYEFETLITYAHELANLLDYRRNPKGKDGKQPGFVYGKPGSDPDTGQAVEECMKKKLNNPN